MPESPFRTLTPAGTEILVEPLPHVRSCSVGFWVRRGSCHEGPEEEGLAHFIEHTVFKGTARFPNPRVMAEATDRLGGSLDAFTDKESACFYGKVLREQIPDLLAMLGDLVTTPRFEGEELARERGVILEEIAQSEDQPDDWASELFFANFWSGAPLAHSVLGRREQVEGYGPAEARAFFGKTYRAPNILIAAAGDLEPAAFLELLAPLLAALPAGGGGALPLKPNAPRPFLLNAPRPDLQQASLVIGFPACDHRHPDQVAVNLLSQILGGGMSSRLFMELRERHALCYQVGSYLAHFRDAGALHIAASCAPEKARELVSRAVAECARLAGQGATQEELDRAKLQARTGLVFSQESTSAHMFTLAHQAMNLDRIRNLDEQLSQIEEVDLEQLNRVAAQTLRVEALGVTALGTRSGGEICPSDLLP